MSEFTTMSPLGSKLNFGQMIESCTFNLEKGDAILAKKQDRDIEPLSEAVWTMGVQCNGRLQFMSTAPVYEEISRR